MSETETEIEKEREQDSMREKERGYRHYRHYIHEIGNGHSQTGSAFI